MYYIVRFEVFTVVTMKKAVFWDVAPCRSCVNRRFRGMYRLHLQGRIQEEITNDPVSVAPAHAGSPFTDFFFCSTLKMEAIHSSETSVNTIST
jgi:hypothetical protein